MKEQTHYHMTQAILLACGWEWKHAFVAAIASEATDRCTPAFLGESHLADFPALGWPEPTQIDTSAEMLGSSCYPGWAILATWHGGAAARRECRPIRIGDLDADVAAASVFAVDDPGRLNLTRLGMLLHSAQDTATHTGFWPCWHPTNGNPEYRRRWYMAWQRLIPKVLHAQYLDSVDLIEGKGRNNDGTPTWTRWKVAAETRELCRILSLTADRERIAAVIEAIATASNDASLCAQLDALSRAWAGPDLPARAVWGRGAPEWREFFNVAREG